MPKTVLEMVQCLAGNSMGPLDRLSQEGLQPVHIACVATVEQVRATYCLATVLARIHEQLVEISKELDERGMGHG
jgi:hypothetical protein